MIYFTKPLKTNIGEYFFRLSTINFSFSKTKLCNRFKKENGPMRGACLTKNVVYYVRISYEDKTYKPRLYKVICEKTTFKKRYATQIIQNLLHYKF